MVALPVHRILVRGLIAAGFVRLEVVDPGGGSDVWLALKILNVFGLRLEEPAKEHCERGHCAVPTLYRLPGIASRWLTSR